jgi:hypothetical protein
MPKKTCETDHLVFLFLDVAIVIIVLYVMLDNGNIAMQQIRNIYMIESEQ